MLLCSPFVLILIQYYSRNHYFPMFFFLGLPPRHSELSQGADYTNTSNAVVGDLGSQLPPLETGTTWKLGEHVEVSWATKAWHGGGCD